ncbi:MAG: histidine phosphatase family protein [Acidobacteria bacterium]|nr:histidine phosphatase family protein [Acidobacteriota bacterium]
MMLLVRHAWAGHADKWDGDDRLRPLDKRGRKQAAALVPLLRRFELDRIVSSPYVRCVETVKPLARALGIEIDLDDALGEEFQGSRGAELVRTLLPTAAVACCHGGLAELVCGESLKKGETFALDERARVVKRLRPD